MKIRFYSQYWLLLINFYSIEILAQSPVIQAVTPKMNTVEQNGKFEATLTMTAGFTNPYNYDEIRVQAIFTAPNGEQTTVEGFYMEDFEITNPNTGALTALPNNGFRIRFSPRQTGVWSYTVSCTNTLGTGTFPAQSFTCGPAATPSNQGFVQEGTGNYLHFDNGQQYVPVGENMAWQSGNPYLDYKKWVGKMADNNGNFLRLWLCHWGLGLEWKLNTNGFPGLKQYKQTSAYYLDWLFDYCAEKGVYVMFCLNHHGQVSSQVNPNWSESPYNAVNGGPCQNTWDFFTNSQAKALIKNRLRYVIARWGCQRSIMTWELFNEVNWTDNYDQHKPEIAAWHAEMAAFLKQRDYASRPVSTSYGTPQSEDPAVWNNPDMDYTQRHYYVDNPNLEAILAMGARENLNLFDKPAHIGEFGLNANGGDLGVLDPTGIHLHNNLWGPLFGGAIGSGMTWWWDSYVEPKNLYGHFKGIATILQATNLYGNNFRPTTASVLGAPGDLTLNAALGWGELGDPLIQINNAGVISPVNFKLCQFLYGSVWNTQFRSPPTFSVDMPQSGQFKVQVGSQFGTSPKLIILVDGTQVLSVTPTANQTYTVSIPAGQHQVKVDNSGTDWMTIAGYTFSGLGSAVDAYVLQSLDNKSLTGWVLNRDYNHAFIKANGLPDAVVGATVKVQNLIDGNYQVKWYNCQSGDLMQTETTHIGNGVLNLPVPTLLWDMAFVVENASVGVTDIPVAFPMSIYPNPVTQGPFQVSFYLETTALVTIELYDASGARIQHLFSGTLSSGDQKISTQLLSDLADGVYWVQVTTGNKKAAKAIGVLHP